MAKLNPRVATRLRRKKHIRKKVHGTLERPRLCVFRSARHIYAQVIDDESGRTLASASSLCTEISISGGNRDGAKAVGTLLAERAASVNVKQVVLDRNGYKYHGRVAALADAARAAGLEF